MQTLRQIASKAYYEGNPIMSDEAFDSLPDDGSVGYTPLKDAITLFSRMYSLDKEYVDTLPDYGLRGGRVYSPKLDGASCQIRCESGEIIAMTRGDGNQGKLINPDIVKVLTDNKVIDGIATGEVVTFAGDVANARNVCAGILNSKELTAEVKAKITEYNIKFVAYDVLPLDGSQPASTLMERLDNWPGISVVDYEQLSSCPKDGTVSRINDDSKFYAEGFTDKFPRGATAFKTQDEQHSTTLTGIVWDLGKSGKVTPVALLDTVNIGGANISRATLHNIGYLEELDAAIGDTVTVIRAGQIIPQVIGVEIKPLSRTVINLDINCPSCSSELTRVNTGLFCKNPDCGSQNLKKVVAYCKALGMKGFGEKTLQSMGVQRIEDLYTFKEDNSNNGLSGKRLQNLLDELHKKAYNIPIEKFLVANSIPLVGNVIAAKLKAVPWAELLEADVAKLKSYGVGEKASINLVEGITRAQLMDLPVTISHATEVVSTVAIPEPSLSVCITGKLVDYKNRKEAAEYLETLGIKVTSSVTKNTNYLICEDDTKVGSSSYKKAQTNGIPVVTIINLLEEI